MPFAVKLPCQTPKEIFPIFLDAAFAAWSQPTRSDATHTRLRPTASAVPALLSALPSGMSHLFLQFSKKLSMYSASASSAVWSMIGSILIQKLNACAQYARPYVSTESSIHLALPKMFRFRELISYLFCKFCHFFWSYAIRYSNIITFILHLFYLQ